MPEYKDKECKKHGLTSFVLEGRGYYRCKKCRSNNVAERRRRVKEILVAERGGKCERCGYNKYIGALEFHHRNRKDKELLVSRGATFGIERLRVEADKCDVLCSNCHKEVEANIPM